MQPAWTANEQKRKAPAFDGCHLSESLDSAESLDPHVAANAPYWFD
jgi:hypothetical protein